MPISTLHAIFQLQVNKGLVWLRVTGSVGSCHSGTELLPSLTTALLLKSRAWWHQGTGNPHTFFFFLSGQDILKVEVCIKEKKYIYNVV